MPTKRRLVPTRGKPRRIAYDELGSELRQSGRWKTLARDFRLRHPFCWNPFEKHEYGKPAVVIHHIVPPEKDPNKFFEEDNLVSLCLQCHAPAEKTPHLFSYGMAQRTLEIIERISQGRT